MKCFCKLGKFSFDYVNIFTESESIATNLSKRAHKVKKHYYIKREFIIQQILDGTNEIKSKKQLTVLLKTLYCF